MNLTEEQLNAALSRLERNFGNNLDRGVLTSVLEMFGGDVQQTIGFL